MGMTGRNDGDRRPQHAVNGVSLGLDHDLEVAREQDVARQRAANVTSYCQRLWLDGRRLFEPGPFGREKVAVSQDHDRVNCADCSRVLNPGNPWYATRDGQPRCRRCARRAARQAREAARTARQAGRLEAAVVTTSRTLCRGCGESRLARALVQGYCPRCRYGKEVA